MALHLKLYCLKVVYSISGWSTVEAVAGAGAGQAGRHKGVARGGRRQLFFSNKAILS